VKAQLYSDIGPIEKGLPVRLENDAVMRLEAYKRDHYCHCGSVLGWKHMSIEGRGYGVMHCMADPKHRGFRRNPPPNRPLTPDEIEQRERARRER